jgi:putative endonuclease
VSFDCVRRNGATAPLITPLRTEEYLKSYIVYILECADGSYYTGSTADISKRLWEHDQGFMPSSYTYSRRPVKLVWTSEETARYSEALKWERQIKGWSRAKKQALIRGDFDAIHEIVKAERKQGEQKKKDHPR